ncbi:MAG: hypothetical protein FJ026_11630, partial [Chloroflexi bacterium]|nr:hypothetical protein [Chloroflexota bacterium]
LDELISANILWSEAAGTYRLAHLAWQEYLTARRIFERGELETLAGHVDDPWYEQVFLLLAGLQRKAYALIGLIRERSQNPPRALFLAARCLPEADQTDGQLRAEIAGELFALFREEAPELWPEAAAAIAGLEGQSVEGALLRTLEAQTPEIRQQAAWMLGRVGKGWAVAPLIRALEDPSPHVRQRAAWALGQIRDPRAIQPLMRVFSDHDSSVTTEAAQALANMGPSAVEPLIHTLGAPEEQARQVAITALSLIGTPAIDLLLQALGHERAEVREGAKSALKGIGEPAVERLVSAFATVNSDGLPAIVDVLAEIGGLRALRPLIIALPKARGETRQVLIKNLVHLGEPAVNELSEALLDNDLRETALEALAACGDVATARLSIALRDERWKMRWRATQALGELRRAEALEPLIARLGDSRREVKRAAVEALRQIADQRAVEPLLTVLADEDDAVRWEAAKALGELRDGRAIRPLLAALTDKAESVRQNAASSLVEIGPTVVQPLIATLYERGSRVADAYDYAVDVLDRISTKCTTEHPAQANLAAAYYRLLTGEYTVDEILPSLRELSWWEHGAELYQLFSLLDSLLRCRSIEEITVERNELDRLSNSTRWLLHTELRTWLRNLGEILEDLAWYRVSLIEEARQDVLFRAKTAAKGLEDSAAAFAEPELRALREVSTHLHRLIVEAIGRGTGRAKLQLALRTDQVRIAIPDSPTVLAYDLANIGDAPAWNVRLALKAPSGREFAIVEGKREYPYVLKPGEKRGSDFIVIPRLAGSADLSFDVAYDDATKEGHFGRLSGGKVYFFAKPAPYRPPDGESPYNFSQPVEVPTMFYGRRDILEWVQENIGAKYQENILVLHGHRRTGKSSVLTQLALRQPSPRYLFVLYRADQVGEFGSEGAILYHMARVIQAELSRGGVALPAPIWGEYRSEPRHRFRAFLEELDATLLDRRIALMVDEFDLLIEA